ncbi:MAG: NAD(+) diphosphatase [Paracoccaceae bacterium]
MSLSHPLTFAAGGGEIDRASHLRPESAGLLVRSDARLLPQWRDKALISLGAGRPALGWVAPDPALVAQADEPPVFLGCYRGAPCFTADFSALDEETARTRFGETMKFIDLRSVAGQLTQAEATIYAAAKGVIGWHRIHPFCARCGSPSRPEDAGWRRRCSACGALHFPRTDPVVIMLVTRGERVLLGRQRDWPPGLYSLLAGFMEPGETIADAVRRETREETSVRVGRVRFIASQPWPFPASLMLGCWAEALSEDIVIDAEIDDARWVDRAEMAMALRDEHPQFASPRPDSIARWILTAWVAGEIGHGAEDDIAGAEAAC